MRIMEYSDVARDIWKDPFQALQMYLYELIRPGELPVGI